MGRVEAPDFMKGDKEGGQEEVVEVREGKLLT